jgi:hypothetical protein
LPSEIIDESDDGTAHPEGDSYSQLLHLATRIPRGKTLKIRGIDSGMVPRAIAVLEREGFEVAMKRGIMYVRTGRRRRETELGLETEER